ncbi:hypothetical protein [Bacteroides pyogenes]|uniref:hypothetical protein n=1 Tax=Bacteroides pyogenes TaxID=310300 RepID=UPI001BA5554F|nr:hypothetical protein [Bacteroides pyogenes]
MVMTSESDIMRFCLYFGASGVCGSAFSAINSILLPMIEKRRRALKKRRRALSSNTAGFEKKAAGFAIEHGGLCDETLPDWSETLLAA